jgi:hypothetical protein
MTAIDQDTLVTKSVQFAPDEYETLHQASREENLPEAVFLKKLVLDGLARRRMEKACLAYANGELNLSGAARYAGVGVEEMMRELKRRGIDCGPSVEQFFDGLEYLLDTFGGDEATYKALKEIRQREGVES